MVDEMSEQQHTLGDAEVPEVVLVLAGGREPELVWHNELGGLTFRVEDRYIKWNPRSSGIDLEVWIGRSPVELGIRPPVDEPVLVHGDACAPNTLVSADGAWTGNVDFGDLGIGDRGADLAIASLSLDWNFGEGHQHTLYEGLRD